jgi:hypothetical protein
MTTAQRLHTAGVDAFNQGKPCVPGLDVLWHRELSTDRQSNQAYTTARYWRIGWLYQARLVERVAS